MPRNEEPVEATTPNVAQAIETDLGAEVSRLEREIDSLRRAGLEALFPETGGHLLGHATEELGRAGLLDPDSDYEGMIGRAVLDLIRVFATEGHSGSSASVTIDLFSRLARFDVLTSLTAHPSEWMEVGTGVFQNRRKPSVFWRAGEESWYDLDAPKKGEPE